MPEATSAWAKKLKAQKFLWFDHGLFLHIFPAFLQEASGVFGKWGVLAASAGWPQGSPTALAAGLLCTTERLVISSKDTGVPAAEATRLRWQLLQMPQLVSSPAGAQSPTPASPHPTTLRPATPSWWQRGFHSPHARSNPHPPDSARQDGDKSLHAAPPLRCWGSAGLEDCVPDSPLFPLRPHRLSCPPPPAYKQDKPRLDHILPGGQFCSSRDPVQLKPDWQPTWSKHSDAETRCGHLDCKVSNGQSGGRRWGGPEAADWTLKMWGGGRAAAGKEEGRSPADAKNKKEKKKTQPWG